jgi:hypothetical protein
VKTLKQQLLDKLDQQGFSRQTLIELGDICSKWLNPKRAYPRGIFDHVVIYVLRDFCFSLENWMVGQEDKLSGITTVQHAKIQSMVVSP